MPRGPAACRKEPSGPAGFRCRAPPVSRPDDQKADSAVLWGECRSSGKFSFRPGAKGRISGSAPFHDATMISRSHAGKIVPDGCGHFHPGGKIRRRGLTDENGGMGWQGGHGRRIKTCTIFWKSLQKPVPDAYLIHYF